MISVLTRIELEGGVTRAPDFAGIRRANVDALVSRLEVLPFDGQCADAYGRILSATGWSRARIFDRMIGATALVHQLTLVTMNGDDFSDVPGLSLMIWPSPS